MSGLREASGHEIDVIIDRGNDLLALEVKSAQTVASDSFDNLHLWRKMTQLEDTPLAFVYGGDQGFRRAGVVAYPWYVL